MYVIIIKMGSNFLSRSSNETAVSPFASAGKWNKLRTKTKENVRLSLSLIRCNIRSSHSRR